MSLYLGKLLKDYKYNLMRKQSSTTKFSLIRIINDGLTFFFTAGEEERGVRQVDGGHRDFFLGCTCRDVTSG